MFFFFLLFAICMSCRNTQDGSDMYEKLILAMDKLEPDSAVSDEVVMIINLQGCSVCYSRALYFLERNLDRTDRVKYLITGVRSLKELKIRLGDRVVSHERVTVDVGDEISLAGIKESYPLIFYQKNDLFDRLDVADVNNVNAYTDLITHLGLDGEISVADRPWNNIDVR